MSEVKNEGLEAGLSTFIYAHELLASGGGVWLGCESESVVKSSHIDGETGDEVVALCRHSEALAGYAERDTRIAELEASYQDCHASKEAFAQNAIDLQGQRDQLRAELAAIKAQEPVGWYTDNHLTDKSSTTYDWAVAERWADKGWQIFPLYAAPVAKQVVMPERVVWIDAHHIVPGTGPALIGGMCLVSPEQLSGTQVPLTLCRLNAADHAEGGV